MAKLTHARRQEILDRLAEYTYDMWRGDPKEAARELTEQYMQRITRMNNDRLLKEFNEVFGDLDSPASDWLERQRDF